MEVVVTTGLLELKVVQSSSQIITTNKPTSSFFTGRMPFLSPNQQCQSTEWKNITFHGLAGLKLTWGLPTLSLTTNSSWLPWESCHASHQPSDASIPTTYDFLLVISFEKLLSLSQTC